MFNSKMDLNTDRYKQMTARYSANPPFVKVIDGLTAFNLGWLGKNLVHRATPAFTHWSLQRDFKANVFQVTDVHNGKRQVFGFTGQGVRMANFKLPLSDFTDCKLNGIAPALSEQLVSIKHASVSVEKAYVVKALIGNSVYVSDQLRNAIKMRYPVSIPFCLLLPLIAPRMLM